MTSVLEGSWSTDSDFQIVAFDTETSEILPGLLAPDMACLTWAEQDKEDKRKIARNILPPEEGVSWLESQLDARALVVTLNGTFDLAVAVAQAERQGGEQGGRRLIKKIFQALEDGRISDVSMRESLLLLAKGILSSDPNDRGRRPGVSLEAIARRRLGIDLSADKKNPDAWRLRYGELIGVPLSLWPEEALRYAKDDAALTLLLYFDQLKEAAEMEYQDLEGEESQTSYLDPDCPGLIVDEGKKLAAAWALHLSSCWGLRTDGSRVSSTVARIEEAARACEALVVATGLGVWKTKHGAQKVSQVRKEIQKRVALAYLGLEIDLDMYAGGLPAGENEGEEAQDQEEDQETESDFEVDSGDLSLEQQDLLRRVLAHPEEVALTPPPALPEHVEVVSLPAIYRGKEKPGGGGTAYRDSRTGALLTPVTPPSKTFPQGQVSYSREVLEGSEDQVLLLLAALGRVMKLRSTYVPILAHGTVHPIQPRYWLPKESGRTSASGPNVQNLPTFGGVRECFWARSCADFLGLPDVLGRCAILSADIDQAECLAWGQWCFETFGFSRMLEILNEDKDPHLWMALHFPQISHLDYDQAKALKKAGDPLVKKIRQLAKVGIFGRMGGMGAATLRKAAKGQGVIISLEEAELIIAVFDQAFPEGRYAAAWVSERCPGDCLFTFVQRVSGRRRGGCGYTDGRNQPFQGGIADLAGDCLFHIAKECYAEEDSPLFGARIWAFVHDEFNLEVPYDYWGPERATRAAERLEQIIAERGRFWFPDVPVKAGAGYARRWIKDRIAGTEITAVRNAAGYLVPCDDPPEMLLS